MFAGPLMTAALEDVFILQAKVMVCVERNAAWSPDLRVLSLRIAAMAIAHWCQAKRMGIVRDRFLIVRWMEERHVTANSNRPNFNR